MEFLFIVIVIAAVALVIIYNRLVSLKQSRLQSFADIDVQLRQRSDLIPNLVETVKAYASHEKELLESITEARSNAMKSSDMDSKIKAESQLSASLFKLFAVAENYPDLKANENFIKLQDEISDIENKIAAARRFFNNSTGEYNASIKQFPAILFARMLGFKEEVFFELDVEQRQQMEEPPKVNFG